MWNKIKTAYLLVLIGLLAACGDKGAGENEITEERPAEKEGKIFHQQKSLQAGDSLHIRLLSWGGESIGNYLLLFADTARSRYIGNSFFRKGQIQNAWVDDLDGDSLPEVAVVLKEQAGDKYGRVILHELAVPFQLSTITMPQLSESIAATYGGYDSIYLDNGQIIQEFRIRDRTDSLAAQPERQRVVYVLENNGLRVVDAQKIQ